MPVKMLTYRSDPEGDTVVLTHDNAVVGAWQVDSVLFRKFCDCTIAPSDWEQTCDADATFPDWWGEELAYRHNHSLGVVDVKAFGAGVELFKMAERDGRLHHLRSEIVAATGTTWADLLGDEGGDA